MFFARVTKVVGTPVQSLRFCDKRFWDITMADEKDKRSEGSESDTPTVNVEEIVVGCNELGEIVSKKLNLFILNTTLRKKKHLQLFLAALQFGVGWKV